MAIFEGKKLQPTRSLQLCHYLHQLWRTQSTSLAAKTSKLELTIFPCKFSIFWGFISWRLLYNLSLRLRQPFHHPAMKFSSLSSILQDPSRHRLGYLGWNIFFSSSMIKKDNQHVRSILYLSQVLSAPAASIRFFVNTYLAWTQFPHQQQSENFQQ